MFQTHCPATCQFKIFSHCISLSYSTQISLISSAQLCSRLLCHQMFIIKSHNKYMICTCTCFYLQSSQTCNEFFQTWSKILPIRSSYDWVGLWRVIFLHSIILNLKQVPFTIPKYLQTYQSAWSDNYYLDAEVVPTQFQNEVSEFKGLFTPWTTKLSQGPVKFVIGFWTHPAVTSLTTKEKKGKKS